MRDQISGANEFISFPSRAVAAAGQGGYYYDYAVRRFLPVSRHSVSPDGSRYAYTSGYLPNATTAPRLHIVNAATGAEIHVFPMPDAQPYEVIDFTVDGVYLILSYEGTGPGVWRADPATGSVTKVSNGYYVPAGPTWIEVRDPRDPNPVRSAENDEPQPDRIDRRDASGTISTWFYRPGAAVYGVGFVKPVQVLVFAFSGDAADWTAEVWLVTAPGSARLLATSTPGTPLSHPEMWGWASAIADVNGVWVGGTDGLYLISPAGVFMRVFDQQVDPANGCF